MKFNCGLTPEEKAKRKEQARIWRENGLKDWHIKFAWWPTRVAAFDCRWLEYIERKGTHWHVENFDTMLAMIAIGVPSSGWTWEYRALGCRTSMPYKI